MMEEEIRRMIGKEEKVRRGKDVEGVVVRK